MSLLKLESNSIIIFTDGSSRGNPGPGGYGAVAIYPNAHGEMMVDEIGGRENLTTNNRMELRAVIESIKNFVNYYQNLSEHSFIFYIDSGYVVKGIREWMPKWKRNNWMTGAKEPVKNRDLWEELSDLIETGRVSGAKNAEKNKINAALNVVLNQIEGHAGVAGNERCDVISTEFADLKTGDAPISLFTGPLSTYVREVSGVEHILDTKAVHQDRKDALKKRKSSSKNRSNAIGPDGKKAAAYSYISAVDGKIETHATWAECEKRVKGKSGARFKKSFSANEEREIIESFKR